MLSAFTSIILRAKKAVNRILPKQFVQLLAQRAILCIGQRIAHTEVILLPVMLLRESENIVCRNAIDNFGRGQTVDLLFKDMFQPLLGVRECGFHMRSAIGLPKSGPVGNLTHILENNGIMVVLVSPPKREKFRGYSAISNKGFAIIAINSSYDGAQQRYALACELAAMLFHDVGNADLEDIVSHFLLPAADLCRELGEKRKHLSFAEIRYVCDEYSISPQMVAKRAEQKHIISHSAHQQLLRQIREMQHFVLPQEKPTRLEQMVQRALADGEINEARAAELLNQWQ